MNRETILSALFARINSTGVFKTASRRFQLSASVNMADKPCIFMLERADLYIRSSEAAPESITMQVELYIYTDAGFDQTIVPASTLNNLIDAVDIVLAPDALSGKQTLGNLVSHCWIEGKVTKDSGDLGGSGVAVIPVKILVPR